ncbi:hypothetical protein Q73A0000_13150 [Kaistella flava (ex Peng et al. 2021)]|uniref:YtkA-like domain-containing protein n=1 Tax=Kaistella flava (ex Peng et al. 2021) TaxID=2038776 RepID=A0A7M2YAE0_9FLAO|nr:hypothetical protein [Kaistella flava (ex Peng et al. 2021)]QOW11238.1 hypothetical protein Q73A0000_13150 [Kaistella flava (ex Peng et al. 2021)]
MKFSFKTIFAVLAMAFLVISCRTSDNDPIDPVNPNTEIEGLLKIKEITNDTHVIELYSKSGATTLGYNDIKLRIKNKSTNQYEKSATVKWTPLMHMTMMSHSCPNSAVQKVTSDGSLYSGYIVFQMPGNATEYWDLKIDYTIGTNNYTATTVVDVPVATKQTVSSFLGSDNVKYVVAYIEPKSPKVAINDMVLGVWKMQDMMTFPVVDGYTVKVDPRMPGMGNHSSPNNVHATQTAAGKLYNGKLSLTMTGYWKINLQLAKGDGTVLAGQEITDANPASTLFFEIEF